MTIALRYKAHNPTKGKTIAPKIPKNNPHFKGQQCKIPSESCIINFKIKSSFALVD